jgi:type IV pilus assembly protein PilF
MRGYFVVCLVLTLSLLGACSPGQTKSGNKEEKQDPAEINTQLGIEYMREGMYGSSMEKLKKALKQNPDYQLAHTSIAILYEKLGEDKLADQHYRKAYNLNRSDSLTLNNYGQYMCRNGRLEEADAMFMAALKDPLYRYPEMVYTNAGICARMRPDIELADKYFRNALQANPKYKPALRDMIRSSFSQQKYLATRAYLQRLQEVEALTPEFLWIGVRAEAALDDRDAVSSYALVLKNQHPESDETQALVQWERKQLER